MLSIKQCNIKYHFWVFGMTWPGIEPRFPGPLVNTLTIIPITQLILLYICLPTVKWFQVFLFNINYSIHHYSFVCTQSNSFKFNSVLLTNWLNIKSDQINFFTNIWPNVIKYYHKNDKIKLTFQGIKWPAKVDMPLNKSQIQTQARLRRVSTKCV